MLWSGVIYNMRVGLGELPTANWAGAVELEPLSNAILTKRVFARQPGNRPRGPKLVQANLALLRRLRWGRSALQSQIATAPS